MTRLLLAAQSGWGKSYLAQYITENNIERYDSAVILDYKDEYRGLCEPGAGPDVTHLIAGPGEMGWSARDWHDILDGNPPVVLARHRLTDSDWRELTAAVIKGARMLTGSCLVVVDEAHFVAPQGKGYPEVIDGLATTGRGERVSSMWVTQRLSLLDKTPVTQSDANVLGGFDGDEISRVRDAVSGYPAHVHDPQADTAVPGDLRAHDGADALRMFEDDDGNTIGSEWIYSDSSGERRRIDTRGMQVETTHYSPQGEPITIA